MKAEKVAHLERTIAAAQHIINRERDHLLEWPDSGGKLHFLKTRWLELILLPSLIIVFVCHKCALAFLIWRKLKMLCCGEVCHGLLRIPEYFPVGAFQKFKCWDGTGDKHFHYTCAHINTLKVYTQTARAHNVQCWHVCQGLDMTGAYHERSRPWKQKIYC